MTVKKVLNSSVVLGVDNNGKECILLGKGIGYGKKAGENIPDDSADKIFIPAETNAANSIKQLFSSIPAIYFEITEDIVHYAQNEKNINLNEHIYIVLTDHIHFAVERVKQGICITNRVLWEIKTFYPNEYEIGLYALDKMQQQLKMNFPETEAANIAFHIVNAQKENINQYDAMKAARIMGEIMNIVTYSFKSPIKKESIHYSRFISHMQFFTERFLSGSMLVGEDIINLETMKKSYPKAVECAEKIRTFFIKTYNIALPNEEIAYFAVHIARLISKSQ